MLDAVYCLAWKPLNIISNLSGAEIEVVYAKIEE